ncbi:hypothetical protein K431DRAFT_60054 [Polychaeton citri CBS 116435]|uniref:Uncharacterized protein n=1 Tax=Polychaeton citri CBS 116435 TaxID=1314669 RepID=A0A9P4UPS5_9PEZI|nr:hypothetical protein K431DRAFT_60054 [Polychaeton citri CBS 116435]
MCVCVYVCMCVCVDELDGFGQHMLAALSNCVVHARVRPSHPQISTAYHPLLVVVAVVHPITQSCRAGRGPGVCVHLRSAESVHSGQRMTMPVVLLHHILLDRARAQSLLTTAASLPTPSAPSTTLRWAGLGWASEVSWVGGMWPSMAHHAVLDSFITVAQRWLTTADTRSPLPSLPLLGSISARLYAPPARPSSPIANPSPPSPFHSTQTASIVVHSMLHHALSAYPAHDRPATTLSRSVRLAAGRFRLGGRNHELLQHWL